MVRNCVLFVWLPSLLLAQAPPPNDLCANALPLLPIVSGTFVGATPSSSIPTPAACNNSDAGAVDVWYVFLAPQNGVMNLSVTLTSGPFTGSGGGSVFYAGNCSGLTLVPSLSTCQASNCQVTAGTTYYARASVSAGLYGYPDFTMTAQFVAIQCASSGLTLAFSGERLGDPFALNLGGTPGVSGLLGVDVASGSVSTPIGPVCLGLTPALQLLPFTLDGSGQFAISGLLPLQAGLIGFSAFLQAAAVDTSQPSGSALSNSASLSLRPPRLFFIDPGSPVGGGLGLPGSWCAYDAMADAVVLGPITLPGFVRDAVVVKSLGWLAFLLFDSVGFSLQLYDGKTGFPVLSMPVGSGFSGNPLALAVDGNTLYLMYFGDTTPGLPPGPGGVRGLSLPSGIPGPFVQLASGNPDAIIVLPGTGVAYLRTGTTIALVDAVAGVELPSIALGGLSPITEWLLHGTTLYCLQGAAVGVSPALDAIDTTTHTPLFPAPVSLGFTGFITSAKMLRYGPGQFGDCLFVYNSNLAAPLVQVDPTTLVPINGIVTSGGLTEMTLSQGGTEWLLLCNQTPFFLGCGGAPLLQKMQVPSMSVSTITPLLPHMQLLVSLPSSTLRRAFTVFDTHLVLPFNTDPATVPASTVALPFPIGAPGSYHLRVLID